MTRPGRNEPCPCGSGKKYKLCHGAVAMLQPAPAAARECGPCTACCEGWAEGEIRGHRMHPGQPCHFLRPPEARTGADSPCSIYEERPHSPCRTFVCGWRVPGSPFPDEFRPDQLGVIMVPTYWRERSAWILLAAGRDPDPPLIEWMQRHAHATGQPFFYAQNGQRLGYGPALFQQDMREKIARGEKLW